MKIKVLCLDDELSCISKAMHLYRTPHCPSFPPSLSRPPSRVTRMLDVQRHHNTGVPGSWVLGYMWIMTHRQKGERRASGRPTENIPRSSAIPGSICCSVIGTGASLT